MSSLYHSSQNFYNLGGQRIVCFKNDINKIKYLYAKEMRKNPTYAESVFWNLVKNKKTGFKFRRQSPILGYIVDFYCPKLALVIEIDGGYHIDNKNYDNNRDTILKNYGFFVVRFTNLEILSKSERLMSFLSELKSGTRSQVTTIKKT